MNTLLKVTRILALVFAVKAGVFLILAAVGATPIPPILLAGLTLTWVAWALLLFYLSRRIESRFSEKGYTYDFKFASRFRRRARKEAPS